MVWYGTIPTESFSNNESSFVKVPLLEDDILELFNMIVDENYRPHGFDSSTERFDIGRWQTE